MESTSQNESHALIEELDLEALRAAAEAASVAPWFYAGPEDADSWNVYGEDGWLVADVAVCTKVYGFGGTDKRHWHGISHEEGIKRADRNATFIAAANPAVILALLDRLRAHA